MGVKDCFGCVNMHHKHYCILNKQYTREEYEKLVPRIIEHMNQTKEWGELFPISMSPFGYNKTSAAMYYPMARTDVLKKGWNWDDVLDTQRSVENILDANSLPDCINDVSDQILSSAIKCETTGKPYKITPPELSFYRRQRLPIPRRCPDQRHLDRFSLRNPREFWDRKCGKCQKDIRSTYKPDRSEIVYCEPCYLGAVY